MPRTNTHNSALNRTLDTVFTGLLTLVFPAHIPAAPTQTRAAPATPLLPEPTEEEKAAVEQKYPGYLTKFAAALDKTHTHFLNDTWITSSDLDNFKKNQCDLAIHQINHTPGVQHNSLVHYSEALEKTLIQHLRSKSPVKKTSSSSTKNTTSTVSGINTSLAYLWTQCDKKEGSSALTAFFNTMADAHGLIQVTGWSTQNENSLFAIFDYHNYMRYKDNIAEARFIVASLIAPFYPLFTEYQDIARREKNTLLKIIRTVVPMLITAGFIIGVTALLPVALPELAFVILAIPLLYLSFALASLYVKTKELVYQGYRHVMYQGDLNNFPEFKLNDNLLDDFGGTAQTIREYYIKALQACDTAEHNYTKQKKLSVQEGTSREINLEKRNALLLEWFDLHDNTKLYKDQTPQIALERLKTDEHALSKQFNAIQKNDEREIKALVCSMSTYLQATFEGAEPANDTSSSHRFFPRCLEHRDEIIRLQALETSIKAKSQNMTA